MINILLIRGPTPLEDWMWSWKSRSVEQCNTSLRPGAIDFLFRVPDRLSCYHRRNKSPILGKSPVLEKLRPSQAIFKDLSIAQQQKIIEKTFFPLKDRLWCQRWAGTAKDAFYITLRGNPQYVFCNSIFDFKQSSEKSMNKSKIPKHFKHSFWKIFEKANGNFKRDFSKNPMIVFSKRDFCFGLRT